MCNICKLWDTTDKKTNEEKSGKTLQYMGNSKLHDPDLVYIFIATCAVTKWQRTNCFFSSVYYNIFVLLYSQKLTSGHPVKKSMACNTMYKEYTFTTWHIRPIMWCFAQWVLHICHYNLKVILCASEHICSIVRYCFRSFKQL